MGTPIYHANMNGFMTVFLERLWGFRHQRFPLEGKPYAVVVSGAGIGTPETAIEAVKLRMSAYRAVFIGSLWFNSHIFPCLNCGYGLTCKVGRLYEFYGAEGQKKLKITKQLFGQWEASSEVISKLNALAQQIRSPPEPMRRK